MCTVALQPFLIHRFPFGKSTVPSFETLEKKILFLTKDDFRIFQRTEHTLFCQIRDNMFSFSVWHMHVKKIHFKGTVSREGDVYLERRACRDCPRCPPHSWPSCGGGGRRAERLWGTGSRCSTSVPHTTGTALALRKRSPCPFTTAIL